MQAATFLLVAFSGWFLNLTVSPVYITFSLAVLLIALNFANAFGHSRKLMVGISVFFALMLVLYTLFAQRVLLRKVTTSAADHTLINILFSLVYYIMTCLAARNLSKNVLIDMLVKMINITLPLLVIESAYRWMHPVVQHYVSQDLVYYQYKMSSIMYQDSNFVGLYLVTLFFLSTYLRRYYGIQLKTQRILLFALTILTISKAAIAVIVAFWILFDLKTARWKKALLLSMAGFMVGGYMLRELAFGLSVEGKLRIFNLVGNWWASASWFNRLFGVGYGHTREAIGMGAHNIFLTFLLESGLIGLLLMLLFWLLLMRSTKMRGLIIFVPFLTVSMSATAHAVPYLYCILALISIIERQRDTQIQCTENYNIVNTRKRKYGV